MAVRTALTTRVAEKSTARLTGTITDELGAVIPAASLTTLTLTLHMESTVINSVDAVNILNTGRGTVSDAGAVVITLLPADNPIVSDANQIETHVALIEWTWSAGAKAGRHEIAFGVQNIGRVT